MQHRNEASVRRTRTARGAQPIAEHATPLMLHARVPTLFALVLGLLLAAFALPQPARSECTLDGSTVTCPAGETNDTGYDAGTDETLTVNIEPEASVTNTDTAADVIQLNSGNLVDNRGTLTATGTQSALVAKDTNEVQNQLAGVIESNGSEPTVDFTGDDVATDTGNRVLNLGRIQNAGSGPALRFQMPVDPNWNVFENRYTNGQPAPQISTATGASAILGSDGVDWIVNQGNIGDPDADMDVLKTGSIRLGDGDDIVDNQILEDGTQAEIFGDIDMGAGKDQVFNGGVIWGDVNLGEDTDIFGIVVDSSGIQEIGNAGTIHGKVSLGGTTYFDPPTTPEEEEAEAANQNLFSNSGIVGESLASPSELAIEGGTGRDSVLNASGGIVKGRIELGAHDDVFQNAGEVYGTVDLGAGNDQLIWDIWYTDSSMGQAIGGAGDEDELILRNPGRDSVVFVDLPTFSLNDFGGFEELTFGLPSDYVGVTTRDGVQQDLLMSGLYTISGSLPAATFSSVRFDNGFMQQDQSTFSVPVTAGTNSRQLFFIWGDEDPDNPNDHLQVNSELIIEGGAMLVVGLDSELTILTSLKPGETDSYTLIDYGSRFDDTEFDFAPLDEYAVFDMALIYDDSANNITLNISRFTYAQTAETENQTIVATYLDDAFASLDTSTEFKAAMLPLDFLNSEDIQLAFDQLSPESYDAQTTAALSAGRLFSRALLEGPVQCRTRTHETLTNRLTSNAYCDGSEWNPFQILFVESGSRSGDSIEFDNSTSGLIAGASKRFGGQFALAFAVGASRTSVDLKELGGGDAVLAMAGLATAWGNSGGFQLKSSLGYTHGWHDTGRKISFDGADTEGSHQSDQLAAEIEASYGFETGGWDLRPLASLDAAYLIEESLAETETSEFSLDVDQRDNQVVGGSVGFRVSKPFPHYRFRIASSMSDGIWTPEFMLRARGVITGSDHAIQGAMQGAPESIGSIDLVAEDSRYAAEFGAGLTFQPRDQKNTFGVSYNGMVGEKSTGHRFKADFHLPLDQKFLIGKIEPLLFKGSGMLARGARF